MRATMRKLPMSFCRQPTIHLYTYAYLNVCVFFFFFILYFVFRCYVFLCFTFAADVSPPFTIQWTHKIGRITLSTASELCDSCVCMSCFFFWCWPWLEKKKNDARVRQTHSWYVQVKKRARKKLQQENSVRLLACYYVCILMQVMGKKRV